MSEEKSNLVPLIPSKYFPKFEANLPSAEGKVVVITGTTSGTGYVAALTALKKGAHVVCLNRKSERADKSIQKLIEESKSDEVELVPCDLQDFESVRAAAATLQEKFGESGIDVLCNNAGVMAFEDIETKDGFDIQMQTNHLSHFLLTALLFPLLEKAAEIKGEARVVNHSSGARSLPPTPFNRKYLQKKNGKSLGGNSANMVYGGRWIRYHQTKLANSIFTLEMNRRLKKAKSKVKVFCAHPGLATTELQVSTAKNKGMTDSGVRSLMKNGQSAEDGAMGILRGMLDSPKRVESGALYGPFVFKGPATKRYHGILSLSKANGKTLWTESEKSTGVTFQI